VNERSVDPSGLFFSLSSHRYSYIGLLFIFVLSPNDKKHQKQPYPGFRSFEVQIRVYGLELLVSVWFVINDHSDNLGITCFFGCVSSPILPDPLYISFCTCVLPK
jgi:hypothetical protein